MFKAAWLLHSGMTRVWFRAGGHVVGFLPAKPQSLAFCFLHVLNMKELFKDTFDEAQLRNVGNGTSDVTIFYC